MCRHKLTIKNRDYPEIGFLQFRHAVAFAAAESDCDEQQQQSQEIGRIKAQIASNRSDGSCRFMHKVSYPAFPVASRQPLSLSCRIRTATSPMARAPPLAGCF